jgi:hypothetical protein
VGHPWLPGAPGGGILGPEEGASLSDYTKYQESTGSKVDTYTFSVSKSDQAKIFQNAEKIGDPRGMSCATSVTQAIKGVGLFAGVKETMLPGGVADQMKQIQTAIAVQKVGELVMHAIF